MSTPPKSLKVSWSPWRSGFLTSLASSLSDLHLSSMLQPRWMIFLSFTFSLASESLTNIPKETSRIFCSHLPLFTYSTHYPHNPTPCSFGFPLTYILSFTDSSLRIKSFGPSLTQSAPPNYLCKHTTPTACCVSPAPSGHSIVNPQYSREGCWIPWLPCQRIHKVAICHFARQETKTWCLACFPCRPLARTP